MTLPAASFFQAFLSTIPLSTTKQITGPTWQEESPYESAPSVSGDRDLPICFGVLRPCKFADWANGDCPCNKSSRFIRAIICGNTVGSHGSL